MTKSIKVWHIVNWSERYEIPEDHREDKPKQGPLRFVRRPTPFAGGDKDLADYQRTMSIIRGLPDRCLLHTVHDELVALAATYERARRGYLIDPAGVPYTEEQISLLLSMEVEQVGKALAALASLGLIERVSLQRFRTDYKAISGSPVKTASTQGTDVPHDDPAKAGEEQDLQQKTTNLRVPGDSGNQPGSIRDGPGMIRDGPGTLSRVTGTGTGTGTANGQRQQEPEKQLRPYRPSEPEPLHAPEPVPLRAPEPVPLRGAETGTCTQEPPIPRPGMPCRATTVDERHVHAPTTAPPLSPDGESSLPTLSDAGGQARSRGSPPLSLQAAIDRQRSAILDPLAAYSEPAKAFGAEVYQLLGCPWSPTSREGRRQLGNFAAAYESAAEDVPLGMMGELAAKGLKKAAGIGSRRGKYRNPQAVWRDDWKKHVYARSVVGTRSDPGKQAV